jgi:hypothetical protein
MTAIVIVEACMAVRNAVLLTSASWLPGQACRPARRLWPANRSRAYGPTVMGSEAVGLAPIGALVLTLVIVTSTADAPWLTVKF